MARCNTAQKLKIEAETEMKKIVLFMMLFISVIASAQGDTKPKNIIILFADGTTSSQYEFGRYSSVLLRQQSFAVTDIVMAKGQ